MPSQKGHSSDDHRKIIRRMSEYERMSLCLLVAISDKLSHLISQGCGKGRRATGFGFIVGLPTNKEKDPTMPLELKITNEQQVKVTLAPKTDTGKPASLDGMPSWAVITGNSRLNVSEDGLSAMLVSADDPGDTEVLIKADADLGEGIEEISDILKLSVIGATAKNLGMTAGTPEAKPTPTPTP